MVNRLGSYFSPSTKFHSWLFLHNHARIMSALVTQVGVLHNALVPSLGVHAALSLGTYAIARVTRRVELKDWLWPSGLVINAWYQALRPAIYSDRPVGLVLKSLPWTQQLLLGGVTVWGTRLFYRIVSRSLRRGTDDPRYESVRNDSSWWNKALFSVFGMEAIAQALIGLSWSIPISNPIGAHTTSIVTPPSAQIASVVHDVAVGLFSAGLAMETLADYQLESHKQNATSSTLQRSGVWSIVRHPNYLGDALVHASFPLLAYAASSLNVYSLIGPVANYLFLRLVGGDKENEASQEQRYRESNPSKLKQLKEWRGEKNSFWPGLKELGNIWVWGLVALGGAGVGAERYLKTLSPMP